MATYEDSVRLYMMPRGGLVLAEDLGAMLVELVGLLDHSASPMARLFPNLQTTKATLFVPSVTQGSLNLDLLVKFAFGDQMTTGQVVDKIREAMGVDKLPFRGQVLVLVGLAVLLYGGATLVNDVIGPREAATISNNYGTIVQIIGSEIDLPADRIREMIESQGQPRRRTAERLDAILAPARGGEGIAVNGAQAITPETIRAIPSGLRRIVEPISRSVHHDSLQVHIVRSDAEYIHTGWQVRAPLLSTRRIRARLSPSIPPGSYHAGLHARVAAWVTLVENRDGDLVPSEVLIEEIIEVLPPPADDLAGH